MHNTLLLTKVLLINAGAKFQIKFRKTNTKATTIIFWLSIGLCFIPVVSILYTFYASMYDAFASINQLELLASVLINIMKLVIFIFALFSIPAVFYFSRDIENLLPLPLRDIEIISAKFIVTLIFEYLLLALFLLPFYAVVIQHVNPYIFIPMGIVMFLTLPVLPLCYASVIVMFMMSFSRFSKNREAFNIIAGVLGVAVGLCANFAIQGITRLNTEQITQALLNGDSIFNSIAFLFPDNRFAASATISGSFIGLINSIVISVAVYCIFLLVARLFYLKGAMGASDSGKSGKKLTAGHVLGHSRLRSPFKAYLQKEVSLLFRSPVTFLNCVLIELLFPLMILIPLFFTPDSIQELKSLHISGGKPAVIALSITAAVVMFMGLMNNIAATAISREGTCYFFMKYIPLHYAVQINAKVFSGLLVGGCGSVLTLLGASFLISVSFPVLLSGLALGLFGSVLLNYLGILVDLFYPKLQWDSEQYAVKQNLNVLIVMFLGLVLVLLLVVPCVLVFSNPFPAGVTMFVLLSLANILVYRFVIRLGIKKLQQL